MKSIPVAGLATAGLVKAAQNAPHNPSLKFPSAPRKRLAVTSWPFRAYIEAPDNRGRDRSKPGMDMKQFPAMVAEKFGVTNINPLSAHFSSSDPAYLEEFRKAVADAHSHVVDLGLGGGPFYDADASKREAAVAASRKWIDVAVTIGSPSVRQHIQGAKGAKPDVELAAKSLGALAEYGAKRNIVVNLENDNAVAEDPFFILSVIERLKNPYLRALPDFGNSLPPHDEAFNERAVDAMFKHAFNMVHVKDVITHNGKETHVDLAKMFSIAKANSYRGYFSMEFDTSSGDAIEGTRHLVEQSLKYLG